MQHLRWFFFLFKFLAQDKIYVLFGLLVACNIIMYIEGRHNLGCISTVPSYPNKKFKYLCTNILWWFKKPVFIIQNFTYTWKNLITWLKIYIKLHWNIYDYISQVRNSPYTGMSNFWYLGSVQNLITNWYFKLNLKKFLHSKNSNFWRRLYASYCMRIVCYF